MKTFVVYGLQSKIIRQIIVSDEIDSLSAPDKCGVLEVPFDSYSQFNANKLSEYVVQQIGEPLHDGRCVEVGQDGKVLAVYNADPLIDKPILGRTNQIIPHEIAGIGDIKQADESFIYVKPNAEDAQAAAAFLAAVNERNR